MLEKLKKSLIKAPIIKKKEYKYFVHPITDGIPVVDPSILEETAEAIAMVGNMEVDKIVCVEAMGIHIATALSIKTGIPFSVIRKRVYGLEGEALVHQTTGYSKGQLYINGLEKGDKIILVDDVVSTGGTLIAVLKALERMGVDVVDVIAVIEKGNGNDIVKNATGINIKSLLKINVEEGKVVIEGSADDSL
jgi:adenine phosphoribosyltransferase